MNGWSKHWHVVVYLVGLIFLAGAGWTQISEANKKADTNRDNIEETTEEIKEVSERLIRVETKQEDIKDDVEEIKRDIKKILEAVGQE